VILLAKLKEYSTVIIALVAAGSIVMGGLSYFAKAEDLRLVQLRLDQKIVSDQLHDVRKQMWTLEDRHREDGRDCLDWHDERDRQQYRELEVQFEGLKLRQDELMKK